MDAITLSIEVGQDHRLVIQLPDDVPPGFVEVTIKQTTSNSARDAARSKLLAAGKLSTGYDLPENFTRPSDSELLRLITVPPGTPSIDEIIDEDRGPR